MNKNASNLALKTLRGCRHQIWDACSAVWLLCQG